MLVSNWRRILAPLLISFLLLVTACGGAKEPSRWDSTQKQSTDRGAKVQPNTQQPSNAITGKVVAGSKFNKFFPSAGGGFDRVFTQEKTGFAEAKLKKGGKDVAMLSVSDLANNPTAANKFKSSSKKIGGYPAAVQGNSTSVLVGNRHQVKIQSRDTSFTESDREAWLQKFNLSGIAGVK